MIARDFAAASRREFDLLVVGGGIYGVALLQAAARAGLRACLCEAHDFGGGTSWNSLRIVHGGLRYLQTADLPRFFQSVAARRRLARQFPALVRPLECVMPLYGRGLKRASVLRLALLANDVLSLRRNAGLTTSVRIPNGRIIDRAATMHAFPGIQTEGLEGAASWSDHRMVSSERILIELLRDACRRGADAFNYAPVVELIHEGGVVLGARVIDSRVNESHTITARAVVNCTGPHVGSLAREGGGDAGGLFRPSLAFNLLLDRLMPAERGLAAAAPGPASPVFFVVPQDGSLLAGTMHLPRAAGTTEAMPTEAEIDQFLQALNAAIPGLAVGLRDVRRVFAGLLPVTEPESTNLMKREIILDHGRQGGLQRLYSVSGVKWTTAGDVAAQMLERIGAGGSGDDTELPLSPATGLLTDARQLWTKRPDDLRLMLNIVSADEAVHQFDDLVLRRSNWAATVCDLERVRERVAQLVGWPSELMSTDPGR